LSINIDTINASNHSLLPQVFLALGDSEQIPYFSNINIYIKHADKPKAVIPAWVLTCAHTQKTKEVVFLISKASEV